MLIPHTRSGSSLLIFVSLRRNPPSAPLTIERPLTPPASPKDGVAQLRTEDWSQLPPESTYFLGVNRGKRSVGVNLKDPEGLKIVHELIAKADIFVSGAQMLGSEGRS